MPSSTTQDESDPSVAVGAGNTVYLGWQEGASNATGSKPYVAVTAGDDQKAAFAGAWHLYVATTYDGGVSWTTADATPSDPVQRGCIWLAGGSNACGNLPDFFDITVG